MASRIESTRRSRRRLVGLTLAFAIAAALGAWLVVVGSPALPSPPAPFFTTMVSPSSTCPRSNAVRDRSETEPDRRKMSLALELITPAARRTGT